MKQRVLAARGLPGSGKSTWLYPHYWNDTENWRYIERDSIREEIIGEKKWNGKLESEVVKERNRLLREHLGNGYNVVIDETFLNPKMLESVKSIVAEYLGVEFELKDFTDVDIGVCIERDRTRGKRSVGAGAIRKNAKKWLRQPEPEYKLHTPTAIICDLDGTLALFGNANPYNRDWSRDQINYPILKILQLFNESGCDILITSGRTEVAIKATEEWLFDNGITYTKLFMRPESDNRKDSIFKKELYEREILGKYNILFVIDDRDQVVDMWRCLGLTCLQVDYGDF